MARAKTRCILASSKLRISNTAYLLTKHLINYIASSFYPLVFLRKKHFIERSKIVHSSLHRMALIECLLNFTKLQQNWECICNNNLLKVILNTFLVEITWNTEHPVYEIIYKIRIFITNATLLNSFERESFFYELIFIKC